MSDVKQTKIEFANEATILEDAGGNSKNELNLYHYEVKTKMKNPFVIIIGIAKYQNNNNWKNLPSVKEDIKMMTKLFHTTLGYNTKILTDCKVVNDERYDTLDTFCTAEHIQAFLEYECLRVVKDQQKTKKNTWVYDGLICIVSAHGLCDSIVASDGQLINIKQDLFDPFNPRKAKKLKQFPKIYIFDACRGTLPPDIVVEMELIKGKPDFKFMSNNIESDYRISYATTEGKNAPIRSDGGIFIRPFYEIMMHLHKKDFLNSYSFQRILKMSSRMAKK
eukprot:520890_1